MTSDTLCDMEKSERSACHRHRVECPCLTVFALIITVARSGMLLITCWFPWMVNIWDHLNQPAAEMKHRCYVLCGASAECDRYEFTRRCTYAEPAGPCKLRKDGASFLEM